MIHWETTIKLYDEKCVINLQNRKTLLDGLPIPNISCEHKEDLVLEIGNYQIGCAIDNGLTVDLYKKLKKKSLAPISKR